MTDDPERVWLSPVCESKTFDGRTWCANNEWPKGCAECGSPPTEYVRADLARAEAYKLRLLLLGGEDAPGAAMAPTLDEIKELHHKHTTERDERDRSTRLLADALREAVAPLVAIADAFDVSGLDEHRPEWGARDPKTVELLAGRGGRALLTLADCLRARDLLRALNQGT